jgi:hypothetical protein
MSYKISAFFTFVVLLAVGPVWAHHNNVRFDPGKRVTLTGTLSRLDWRNPHIYMYMEAKNDRGQVETWSLECQPPNFFAIRKVSKTDFEKILGQTVTAEFSPARDGSSNGLLWRITLPDGRVVAGRG